MPSPLQDVMSGLQPIIAALTRRIKALEAKEAAVASLGVRFTTFATLATGKEGQIVKCTNCRKGAEGAGAGTGCLVYWNVATSTWLRVYDNAAASA